MGAIDPFGHQRGTLLELHFTGFEGLHEGDFVVSQRIEDREFPERATAALDQFEPP